MRWWTIIVSVGLHALAAWIFADARFAVPAPSPVPTSYVELAMVELPDEPTPSPSPAPAPEPVHEAAPERQDEVAKSGTATRSSPPAPSIVASLDPAAAAGDPPAGDPSRSLGMRHDEPSAAPPSSTPDDDAPVLDLGVPTGSAARAARTAGLSTGAPTVNMIGPQRYAVDGTPSVSPNSTLGDSAGGGRYKKKRPQFKADIAADGKVKFKDNERWDDEFYADPKEGVGYRAVFDITDELMRMHGDDPYWAEKLRFLNETREERDGMALVARAERVRQAIGRLPEVLDAIWSESRWTVPYRRQLLFDLWDECVDDGPEDLVQAALEARLTIEAFVRKNLPRGSDAAFTDAELTRLNASRSSRREFRPYRAAE